MSPNQLRRRSIVVLVFASALVPATFQLVSLQRALVVRPGPQRGISTVENFLGTGITAHPPHPESDSPPALISSLLLCGPVVV